MASSLYRPIIEQPELVYFDLDLKSLDILMVEVTFNIDETNYLCAG